MPVQFSPVFCRDPRAFEQGLAVFLCVEPSDPEAAETVPALMPESAAMLAMHEVAAAAVARLQSGNITSVLGSDQPITTSFGDVRLNQVDQPPLFSTIVMIDQDQTLTTPDGDKRGDDILQWLEEKVRQNNTGPLQAGTGRVCERGRCPASCNNQCTADGDRQCCDKRDAIPLPQLAEAGN